MQNYKAAGIIFYRYQFISSLKKTFLQVYLQYEYRLNKWSHFGGKRENYDKNSFETAIREMVEEIDVSCYNIVEFLKYNKLEKKYFSKSKMIVYYVDASKITDSKLIEANWFTIDCLPNNIRSHIIEQLEEIKEYDFVNYFNMCKIASY